MLIGVAVGAACSTKHVERKDACVPTGAARIESAPTADMSGEFALTLAATTGPKSQYRVAGKVWLVSSDADHRHPFTMGGAKVEDVVTPYFGWAEVELEAVGALEIGDVSSRDPNEPGVLWLEQRVGAPDGPVSITIRLGSLANRSGSQEFDGSYTALHVYEASPSRFAGEWISGSMGRQTTGYFCAERLR